MKRYWCFLVSFFFLPMHSFSNDQIPAELLAIKASKYTCPLMIYKNEYQGHGSGIVFKLPSAQQGNQYLIFTAYHVVSSLIDSSGYSLKTVLKDLNGKECVLRSQLGSSSIIWTNKQMDCAVLKIPIDSVIPKVNSANYIFPGLAYLEEIVPDTSIFLGSDVCMFGWRQHQDIVFPVLKHGLISTILSLDQNYILVDNLASAGMSGGIAFNSSGQGIGFISAALTQSETFGNISLDLSDDLTVIIPYSYVLEQVNSVLNRSSFSP